MVHSFKSFVAQPMLIPLEETANILAVSPSTIRRLIESGDLAPVRIRSRVLVSAEEIRSFITRGGMKSLQESSLPTPSACSGEQVQTTIPESPTP